MESEILSEIKEAEKIADEIMERAERESESLIVQANVSSANLIAEKEHELKKLQEKKIMSARDRAKILKDEKLAEGRDVVKDIRTKVEKNIQKAADFIIKKFEEMLQNA